VLTVLFVALGEGGLNATWGTGNAGGVLRVFALCGAPVTLLAFPLMHWMGVAGASWALLLSSAAMTVAFTRLACRANGLESLRLARDAFRGLFWPLVATIVCTVGLTSLLRPGGWVAIVTVGLAGELVYLAVALWHGFDEDEIALVRGLVGRVARAPQERIEHS
jgi:hypothetical protein